VAAAALAACPTLDHDTHTVGPMRWRRRNGIPRTRATTAARPQHQVTGSSHGAFLSATIAGECSHVCPRVLTRQMRSSVVSSAQLCWTTCTWLGGRSRARKSLHGAGPRGIAGLNTFTPAPAKISVKTYISVTGYVTSEHSAPLHRFFRGPPEGQNQNSGLVTLVTCSRMALILSSNLLDERDTKRESKRSMNLEECWRSLGVNLTGGSPAPNVILVRPSQT